MKVADRISFTVIPGVELSTYWESPVLGPQTVHLLAYAPAPDSDLLSKYMVDAKYDRENRAERIVCKLNELGLSIEWLRVREIAGDAQIGRPHIARAILEKGYETDWNQQSSWHMICEGTLEWTGMWRSSILPMFEGLGISV